MKAKSSKEFGSKVLADEQCHGDADRVERRVSMAATGVIESSSKAHEEMFRDGLRYGDPSAPRYATSRYPAVAPKFPHGRDGVGSGEIPDNDIGKKTVRGSQSVTGDRGGVKSRPANRRASEWRG